LITAAHGPRVVLQAYRTRQGGRTVYGYRAQTLFERLALEVQDLYLHRPRIRRCAFCDALYVPHGNELNCRWALWDAATHEPLEQCATDEMVERWNSNHAGASGTFASDRDRERKRIDQRVYRAHRRSGNNLEAPEMKNALDEREVFQDHFAKKRGPKGQPEAAAVDVVPAADSETLPR
jgi:hypothetical protein